MLRILFFIVSEPLSLSLRILKKIFILKLNFFSALFIVVKTWKQLKCPSTDECIKGPSLWYIHTMEYYSAIKKNGIIPFAAAWMDLEIIVLSEVRQRERQI